jgi:hypothetical protein
LASVALNHDISEAKDNGKARMNLPQDVSLSRCCGAKYI